MTIKPLYPTSKPSLSLNFTNGTGLDGRINFTRPSAATYTGADGLIKTAANGLPRFDNNPLTGQRLGLLVEEARTNLLTNSDTPFTGAIVNSSVTESNYAISPDGLVTATRWRPTAGLVDPGSSSVTTRFFKGINSTAGQVVTQSIYVKPIQVISRYPSPPDTTEADRDVHLQFFSDQQTVSTFLNLRTLAVTGTGTVTNAGNGWYRFSSTYTVVANDSSNQHFVYLTNRNSGFGFDPYPTGTEEVLVWGWQIELGSFPTSYIPTTTATVTRAADSASILNSNIYSKNNFTIITQPFGSAAGVNSLNLIGPIVKQAFVYSTDLPQAQINGVAGNQDGFWRWRVLGDSFALPSFTTNGTVTVDWGDGVIETLNNSVHTFTNGGGYHDIGFRLNSGTFFKPNINGNATYGPRVIALGPAPASMKIDALNGFNNCTALRGFDATVDVSGGTNLANAWIECSNLTSFPLINTGAVTNFFGAWTRCSSLTSFPLINTAAATNLGQAWYACSSLTSFPLLDTAAATFFATAWVNCYGLTSFPLINTGAGTNFSGAWQNCTNLTSFPLINTAAATNLSGAWENCNKLTSFPLINTAAATNLSGAWYLCSSLASFPLLDTAVNTNFQSTFRNCSSLTSFPLISTAAGTTFDSAWRQCSSLTSFPANMFNTTGTLVATAFTDAFFGCALTATSIENILVSLVTNGQSNITLTLSGGTNAGASTWTANAITAYNTLVSRGWTITRNA